MPTLLGLETLKPAPHVTVCASIEMHWRLQYTVVLYRQSVKTQSMSLGSFRCHYMDRFRKRDCRTTLKEILFDCAVPSRGWSWILGSRPHYTHVIWGRIPTDPIELSVGINLTRTIYVLDEPTIGLHPYNTNQLLRTLHRLKSYNNTLILVEHDQNVIESADHIIELGPGSGEWGGDIVDRVPSLKFTAGESLLVNTYPRENQYGHQTTRRTPRDWITTSSFSL